MGLAAEGASVESLIEGSDATLKLLGSVLERFGIVEIDPAGEPFDPEFHEAISMQPSADVEPNSVLTVVQKGYTLNGRLLRPAMVIVASE
jgi:molecular chaperone GrpE